MRPLLLAVILLPLAAAAQPVHDDAFDDLASLLDEPVQTAATYTQRSSEAPASVTILGAAEIDRMGYRTLGEALATVRGFYLTSDRSYTKLGIRGFSPPDDYNSRVAILVDGVLVRDAVGGAGPLGSELGIPMSAVERIEVVRGPGSTLYGTGALFAVVNVILKDTRTLDGVRGTATAGAFGEYRGEAVAAASITPDVNVSMAVHGLNDSGPDPYFAEYDTPQTLGGVAAGLDWERSWGALAAVQTGALRLDVRYSDRHKADPTAPLGSQFGGDAWTRDRIAAAALRGTHEISPTLSVFGLGSLQSFRRAALYPIYTAYGSASEYALATDATTARTEGRILWDPAPAHRIVAGAEMTSELQSHYQTTVGGVETFDADSPYRVVAAYAQAESQVGSAVAVTAGLRLDGVRGDMAVSPRGAIVVTPDTRTSVKLVAGSAFRAPSTYERFYENASVRQIASPDLAPERVFTAEAIAAREVVPGLQLDLAAFATRASGLIYIREIDPATGTRQFVNVGNAYAWGGEGSVLSTRGGWRTRISYGLQWAEDPGLQHHTSTRAPRQIGKATAYGPLGFGLGLAVGTRAESGRPTVQGTTTDAYVVVDAALSADILREAAQITLGVKNAFDTDYAFPGGFKHIQAAIPQRPRTAFLRLDIQL